MRHLSVIIRSISAIGLLGATFNHAGILLHHGLLWDYGGVAWPSAVYWTSLTVVDPVAAILLFARPKLGIMTTVVLIVTNVLHNLMIAAQHALPGELLHHVVSSPLLVSQIAFMLFVGATAPAAWRGLHSPHESIDGVYPAGTDSER